MAAFPSNSHGSSAISSDDEEHDASPSDLPLRNLPHPGDYFFEGQRYNTMAGQSPTERPSSAGGPQEGGSQGISKNTSTNSSRTPSFGHEAQLPGMPRQKGHRVKFSDDGKTLKKPLPSILVPPRDISSSSKATPFPELEIDTTADIADTPQAQISPANSEDEDVDELASRKFQIQSALEAHSRAQRLATTLVGSHSAPGSRRNSSDTMLSPEISPPNGQRNPYPVRIDDIPLLEINGQSHRPYSVYDTDDDEDKPKISEKTTEDILSDPAIRRQRAASNAEAHKLVRAMTGKLNLHRVQAPADGLKSGQITPVEERDPDAYAPRPSEYKTGILASLLKLHDQQNQAATPISAPPSPRQSRFFHSRTNTNDSSTPLTLVGTPGSSPSQSGRSTPKRPKWYDQKSATQSQTSLAGLLSASTMMAGPGMTQANVQPNVRKPARPGMPGRSSSGGIVSAFQKIQKPRLEDEIRITVHIAEVLSRQKYLIKLCRALMQYGAPTHRLEEYMRMSARVLQIEGQFLYIPGCMVVSFDDTTTHTAEVKLVRATQGVDLGKLKDTHTIYKEVVHDMVGVEEATQRLDQILKAKPKFRRMILVPCYGLASAFVGPFAFSARPIDMPICFILGCILGVLQLVVAPASESYANVFDITATVITSFLARAFGSIYDSNGTPYFCFAAMAQSSIALILPGYIILCGSLELQSKSIVAGSVRMVYAVIYALFLGFGITIGTSLYGLMDSNAISSVTCPNSAWSLWDENEYISHFPFVPLFTLCLIVINQAKWSQAPVMVVIAFAGYQVNFWSAKRFANNVQIANALGAFAIGVMGNMYSRLRHGLAAAALLPAIFVQVPSGLAASGSLVSGITSADEITSNSTSGSSSVITNGTSGFYQASTSSTSSSDSSTVYNIGYGMIEVAIGISVGLFLSALVVYPLGKRRSGLFSF